MNILKLKSNIYTTFIMLALFNLVFVSKSVFADVSTNLGLVSQYHFRGIQQTSGASASVGLDYESGNISVGTWAADVEDGLEVDFYGAYSWDIGNDASIAIGATSYQYTGDFDSAYNEINLSARFSNFGVAYSIGKWDGEVGNENATKNNYTILEISYEINSFTGTIGVYGDEAKGEYFDLNYGIQTDYFEIGFGLLVSNLNDDESLYFSFSKAMDL